MRKMTVGFESDGMKFLPAIDSLKCVLSISVSGRMLCNCSEIHSTAKDPTDATQTEGK